MFLPYLVSADTLGVVDEAVLHQALVTAGPYDTNFIGVSIEGDGLCVHFDAQPGAGHVTTVEGVLAAHGDPLANAQHLKIVAIDVRTVELIDGGFVHDAKTFSLSLSAQSKMIAAHGIKDDLAFTYPVVWNTKDDDSTYTIGAGVDHAADAILLNDFYMTAIGTIRAHLDSGTSLKDSVRAASTVGEVDAVVDGR